MFQQWVRWCINHDLKFIVYTCWLLLLPAFLLQYIPLAAKDAMKELEYIKNAKKGK